MEKINRDMWKVFLPTRLISENVFRHDDQLFRRLSDQILNVKNDDQPGRFPVCLVHTNHLNQYHR